MAYNNYNNNSNVKRDKFTGAEYQLKVAKQIVSKKTGDVLPIYKAYVEIKGQLYKVEISDCNKQEVLDKANVDCKWVKVTKCEKQNNGYNRGYNNNNSRSNGGF